MILSIIIFFVMTYGLGWAVTAIVKESKNFLERTIIRIGIGIGVFIILGIVLNIFAIPLDWRIFFCLGMLFPFVYCLDKISSKNFTIPKIGFTKENLNILIVLVMFLITSYMYIDGSFNYNYLEDDDPWVHAEGAKYVSIEKTLSSNNYTFQYMNPYPPGYGMLMGVLHQTNDSISWTLKFFNGLIISLGLVFFYFFAKLFIGDKNRALFATFVLVCIPSFFTHFIWAQTLAVMLFFPAMYCLEMIKFDKKWIYPAMFVIAAIILVAPTKAIKIGIMFGIYWVVKSIIEKKWNLEILGALTSGLCLSLIWWFDKWKPMFFSNSDASNTTLTLWQKIQSAFPYDSGTATQAYTFNDFFIVQPFGGINVHIGWGIVVSILLVLGLICLIIKYKETFAKDNVWIPITLGWFIFTFLGVNSMTFNLPIGFYAFRFWLLLAIPVALLSVLGLRYIIMFFSKLVPTLLIIVIVCFGVLATSGYQKYNQNHNTQWPPGVNWGSQEEVQGYIWMKENLLPNTKVFGLCSNESSGHIIGMDMLDEPWNYSIIKFKQNILNQTADKVNRFMKTDGYNYMIVDSRCIVYYNINQTNQFVNNMLSSTRFITAHQTQGMILLKVI